MSAPLGRPRLVLAAGGHAQRETPEAEGRTPEFPLERDRITIGSGDAQDIRLEGLRAEHGLIRWDSDHDEFSFEPLGVAADSRVDGVPVATAESLHNGDRLEFGSCTLIFQRDEEHDHIRPEGGREGGEYAGGGIAQAGGHNTEPG